MQIITGIGLPVELNLETVTIGYVFKAQFYLPDNSSEYVNFIADPFDVSTHPISSFLRKRSSPDEEPTPTEKPKNIDGIDSEQNERFEKHKVDAEVVESGSVNESTDSIDDGDGLWVPENHIYNDDPLASKVPQNTGTSRWTLYKGMAIIAERFDLKFIQLNKMCEFLLICFSIC